MSEREREKQVEGVKVKALKADTLLVLTAHVCILFIFTFFMCLPGPFHEKQSGRLPKEEEAAEELSWWPQLGAPASSANQREATVNPISLSRRLPAASQCRFFLDVKYAGFILTARWTKVALEA